MSEEQNEINVYESRRFAKALSKLSDAHLCIVEDEIDRIIRAPNIGERKKGDLSHLRVHKFKMDNQLALLGYSWIEEKIEIYLLQFGPHENFYQKMKGQRKRDIKLLKP
ncbi:addiction module toxin RelE [Marinomonas sp. SBI22]|jgi:mRNA-degrading endonuclease RelE of RelBE toxin-antitoxin system|uniref:type II toxin-antitoxin system RelE/ParE family toxin n=1 Tax=unclassified Marinomonas TaxID=196814 RepID=UPI0007AF082D|nr:MULTISPECIES: type II toxin-antitoxin system RelE/ParE family toxin [unclassified Marinomonas]KZM44260.1 addiction module toxin RelE [Marinomonas sp. SBI22]KZM45418.1 addiction module toxin RelE [Marinomonas sp. SBI8L]